MKKITVLLAELFILLITAFGEEAIDITDQTFKIGGFKEEIFYFGFAAGDKIVFNFKEINNKELKEIEIAEYPDNSKFSDYKTKQIDNKIISISKQGVYIFRFKNSTLSGKICKIKIQRIPVSEETKNFDPSVTWETKQETTYNTYVKEVITSYDTTYSQKTEKVLIRTEQKEELIFDKKQRVNPKLSNSGNKTELFFTLPQNQTTAYKTTKVIS